MKFISPWEEIYEYNFDKQEKILMRKMIFPTDPDWEMLILIIIINKKNGS